MKTPNGHEYTMEEGKIFARFDDGEWIEFTSTQAIDNYVKSEKFILEKSSINERYSNLDESSKQIVLAQDRTTHAIRAVVRFLFIQLTAITLALIIGAFGNAIDNGFMIFIAAVIYIVGIIWSSNAGWSELGKSNIPK